MKKRTKRLLIVLLILLIVIVAAAVALVLTDVVQNPWQKEIGEAEAARMAADYVAKHYPEMEGPDVYGNHRELPGSWEFGYRLDVPWGPGQEADTLPFIVIIAIDKKTGDMAVATSP